MLSVEIKIGLLGTNQPLLVVETRLKEIKILPKAMIIQ